MLQLFVITSILFFEVSSYSLLKHRFAYCPPSSKLVLASRSGFFGSFTNLFPNSISSSESGDLESEPIADEDLDNAPAVLTDDICLLPGEPVVRIEEAPSNARRIFTGIDIIANIDDVWEVLTNYERLQDVVKSLVKNEVLLRTERGARLLQVGGAKVLPGDEYLVFF